MHFKTLVRNRRRGPEYVEYQFQRWNGRGPMAMIIAMQLVALIATIAFLDTLDPAPPAASLSLGSTVPVAPR